MLRMFSDARLITVGQKIKDFFSHPDRGAINIERSFTGISETPFFEDAEDIAKIALQLYDGGEVDAIYIVYTRFINMLTHLPTQTRLLPFRAIAGDDGKSPASGGDGDSDGEPGRQGIKSLINYEPSYADFLSQSTPFYLAAVLFGSILESSVCEQCSRTISMDTAVKNSDDMINALTLQYNKARQNAITTELADIIGGTRALRK